VDSIVLGELCTGTLALPRGARGLNSSSGLKQWYGRSIAFPWDAAIARRWALLVVNLKRTGEPLPLLDGMIAATALEHDLTVATRNTRDFRKTGVKVLNPFE
jgi:predicted nucleic acid-binding protein